MGVGNLTKIGSFETAVKALSTAESSHQPLKTNSKRKRVLVRKSPDFCRGY